MKFSRHSSLLLLLPLTVASVAAAQADEPEAQVDRVIKAAMDMRLDDVKPLDLQPKAKSSDSGFYLGGQLVNLSDDARLEERLVGQFPAFVDVRLQSDLRMDSYRLGYRFPISSGQQADALLPISIHSLMGLAVLDAKYFVESAEGLSVEQGLFKAAPLVGWEAEWPVTRVFSLAGEMSSTLPLSNMPWIFSTQVLGRYQLTGRRDGGLRAFAGLGYQRISLSDQNEVISDFNSDSGPMLLLGIEARF